MAKSEIKILMGKIAFHHGGRLKSLMSKDESRKCWMCGNLATTAEHKIKCSDLKLAFPNISLAVGDRMIKTNSVGDESLVQGWQSKEVKYKKNLCKQCNGSISKAWDNAYLDFVLFLSKNPKLVYKNRAVDLKVIYGKNVKESQVHLFRYFAKAFGCAIYETGCEVPIFILDIIYGKSYGKSFFVTVSSIEEIYDYNPTIEGLLGCSDLMSIDDGNTPVAWRWLQNLAWFVIDFRFNLVAPERAIPWTGKSKKILFSPSIKINTT